MSNGKNKDEDKPRDIHPMLADSGHLRDTPLEPVKDLPRLPDMRRFDPDHPGDEEDPFKILDDRERQIALGLVLLREGKSTYEAARESGIPRKTLTDRFRKAEQMLCKPETAKEEQLRELDAENLIQAFSLSQMAGQLFAEEMASGRITGKDAAIGYGISAQRLGDIRGYRNAPQGGDGSTFNDVLERLAELGGGSLELKVTPAAAEAVSAEIDVTPSSSVEDDGRS